MAAGIPDSIRAALREARRFRRIFVSLTVIAPVVVGVIRLFDQQLGSVGVALTVVSLFVGLLAGLVLLFASNENTDVANGFLEEIDRNKELTAKNKRLSGAVKRASIRHAFLQHLTDLGARESISQDEISGLHSYAVAFLVEHCTSLFEFTSTEKWGFCLYEFENETDRLRCLVWRRGWTTPEGHTPRSWKSGAGHVGVAYSRNGELVYPDARAPDVAQLVKPGDATSEYDRYYRSVASIPIQDGNGKAIGVVVATSNRAGRFSPDELAELEPLRDWATFHANLVARAGG